VSPENWFKRTFGDLGMRGGKGAGQIPPGAAGAQQAKHHIEDGAQRVGARPAMSGDQGEIRLKGFPLAISQVAWIAHVHAIQCSSRDRSLYSHTRS
jgi:hypothetical protein